MVVNYTAKGDSFVAETARVVRAAHRPRSQFINYDPAPDGTRIGNYAGGNIGSPICARPRDFRAEFL
jgi:hypothetical protein